MMKIKTFAFTSLALAALLALPAAAQTDYRSDRDYSYNTNTERFGSYSSNLVPCDKLIEEDINTPDGDQLGNIEALVLHPTTHQIAYAVVSTGTGFLGFGSKDRVAIPWSALSFYRDGDDDFDAVLNASGEQIDNALEVDHEDAYVGNERFIRDVYAAFGPQFRNEYEQTFGSGARNQQGRYSDKPQYKQGMTGGRLPMEKLEITNLIGTDVVGTNQNDIGTISDLACDTQNGKLVFAIIEVTSDLKSSMNLSQDHVAVPWAALQPSQDEFRLNVRPANLADLALDYGNQDIQELENQSFAMNVNQAFGVQPYWTDQQMTRRPTGQYQERYNWDTRNRMGRDQQMGRNTWDQPPRTGRDTWQQDQQTRRDTWQQDQQTWQQDPQMGRNTWDLDNRRMSYRGPTSPRAQRGLAQGQPVTVEGTIQHVYTHTAGGMDEMVLHVMNSNGESMFVQAGPNWFAKQMNVDFRKGDRVSVTGHLISSPGQSQTVVARTIETQDQTFTVRDQQLRPEWARR